MAQADFVRDLPWGLATRVGEQGLSLSGGQRQRLALARAVLGKPRLLVLDDPLSALDVHTEALVEEALARVLAGTTAILVVHRPSTVALADRVALLSDGVIAAVGTHSELLATVPAYRSVLSAMAGRTKSCSRGRTCEHRCRTVARSRRRGGRRTDRGRGARRQGDHPAAGLQPEPARLLAAPAPALAGPAGRPAAGPERGRDGRAVPGDARHRPTASRRCSTATPRSLVAVGVAFARRGRRGVRRQAGLPRPVRPDRPGRPARPAPPGVRALPAAVDRASTSGTRPAGWSPG